MQRVPLSSFIYSIFNVRYKTGRDYSAPFWFFFGTVRLFWFFVSKGSPLQVFWYFADKGSFKKPKRTPLSSFPALRDFLEVLNFWKNFYSLQSIPLFWYFAINWNFISPKGPPSSTNSQTLHFLSLRYSADFRRSQSTTFECSFDCQSTNFDAKCQKTVNTRANLFHVICHSWSNWTDLFG